MKLNYLIIGAVRHVDGVQESVHDQVVVGHELFAKGTADLPQRGEHHFPVSVDSVFEEFFRDPFEIIVARVSSTVKIALQDIFLVLDNDHRELRAGINRCGRVDLIIQTL